MELQLGEVGIATMTMALPIPRMNMDFGVANDAVAIGAESEDR